jgi:hypothetical protein
MFTRKQLRILKIKLFLLDLFGPLIFILAIVLAILIIPLAALVLYKESRKPELPTYPFIK